MKSTELPEILGKSLSEIHSGQLRTGGIGDLSAPSAALESGQGAAPRGRTPSWLDQKIAQSRRKARPANCPRCATETLVGPDHDTCSMTARIDTTPVDPITEVAALLTGRHSYDLIRGAIHHREPEHHHSPNRPHPVHLDHICPTPATSGDTPCLF